MLKLVDFFIGKIFFSQTNFAFHTDVKLINARHLNFRASAQPGISSKNLIRKILSNM